LAFTTRPFNLASPIVVAWSSVSHACCADVWVAAGTASRLSPAKDETPTPATPAATSKVEMILRFMSYSLRCAGGRTARRHTDYGGPALGKT
jgi:hypothetical protein